MNAVIVGYFIVDALLADFYTSYASVMKERGVTVKGIELGTSSGGSAPELEVINIDKGFGFGVIIRELLLFPVCWLFYREIFTYAEMQAQSKSLKNWLIFYFRLKSFRRSFRKYLVQNRVRHVLLNHHFSGYHLIAREICEALSVPFAYWHPGFLPGTMSFDYTGQLAESELQSNLLANGLMENGSWIGLGDEYLKWALENGYSRPGKSNVPNDEVIHFLKKMKTVYKKTILVIGCNDYRTGVLPVNYKKSGIHSQLYKSSDILFDDTLSQTCEEIFVVYKPHPNLYPDRSGVEEVSERSVIVFDVPLRDLLGEVDMSVTICSSGAYESLIVGIPAVCVGHLPGSSLGFFNTVDGGVDKLGEALNLVLKEGLSQKQRKTFSNFVGYCLESYFFSHGSSSCPLVKHDLGDALTAVFSEEHL
jgi:hypothetical protein